MNVPGLVQQLLWNIRTGAGIPHVVQRGHPTHGQREEQVIRLVQLVLRVEKCKIAPALHGHGQYIVQNVIRAGEADALLNKRLMPTKAREPLYWDPTGWHNKRIAGGWLYNRCHLIGYQLTEQNNNPKNLITGTRQLNDPDMLKYENMVANYVKSSKKHYVRYRVTPIFRGRELLARGVEMEGQSVGSNAVRFNVYIFNVQPGVKLN